MKRKAIFISAYSRPHYLRVTLESVLRCNGVNEWDVFVSFDGGSERFDWGCIDDLSGWSRINHSVNLGNRDHVTSILQLGSGYEKLLYMDDDHLMLPGSLSYFDRACQGNRTVYNGFFCGTAGVAHPGWHTSASSSCLPRDVVVVTRDYMLDEKFLGRHVIPEHAGHMAHSYDVCWCSAFNDLGIKEHYAPNHMVVNFGLNGGVNIDRAPEFDQDVFGNKHPSEWLESAMEQCLSEKWSSKIPLNLYEK